MKKIFRPRPVSLRQRIFLGYLVAIMLPVLLLGSIWILEEYRDFQHKSTALPEQTLREYRHELQSQLADLVAQVDRLRSEQRRALRTILRERLELLASQIATENSMAEQIQRLRQQNREAEYQVLIGRMIDSQPTWLLLPPDDRQQRRALELGFKRVQHFFMEYRGARDGAARMLYARQIEGSDLILGISQNLADFEQYLRTQVLDLLQESSPVGASLFCATTSGALVWGQASDALVQTGAQLIHNHQRIHSSAIDKDTRPELLAVQHIEGWDWYLGLYIDLQHFSRGIEGAQRELAAHISSQILHIVGILLISALVALGISAMLAQRIRGNFAVFQRFFAEAARDLQPIDEGQFSIREFRDLSGAANQMVRQRLRNDTEIRALNTHLRQSRAQLFRVIDLVPAMIFLTDAQGHILLANHRAAGFLALEERQTGQGYSDSSLLPGQQQRQRELDNEILSQQRDIELEAVSWRNTEGEQRLVQLSKIPFEYDSGIPCVLSVAHDVSEQKQLQGRMGYLAHHDPLTGLPNRLLFYRRFEDALERILERQDRLALIVMDVDRFKDVNDQHGHQAGDQLLREVASRLIQTMRQGDILARLAGDEFTVVIDQLGTDNLAVHAVADRILQAFTRPVVLDGQSLQITPSLGISLAPDNADSIHELIVQADTAMYASKNAGGNTWRFYDPAHQQSPTMLSRRTDAQKDDT